MIARLYKVGFPNPIREQEVNDSYGKKRLRKKWIEDVKNLPDQYYMIISPEDIDYDMKKFEDTVIKKQDERRKYEEFCTEHGIHTECPKLYGIPEKRIHEPYNEESDITIREATKMDIR